MTAESYKLKIVLILTIGFAVAAILGYISQRLRFSPVLGYLLAGYLIGPFSPGFVADLEVSEQLAEIGVILMMFGVGLHFKWEDLMNIKGIAIPGAIGQTVVAALITTLFIYGVGWPLETGIIIGLAIGVASTVVLVRLLSDFNLIHTAVGHSAVGWLIVEDIITVAVLILLPTIATFFTGANVSLPAIGMSVIFILLKFFLLILIMFTLGHKFVSYALFTIARTRSQELFTLTILALTFVIATGSTLLFGTSIALGAFIAGMVIGQTEVRHQASVNYLPLKDAFVVLFFLSVGMLFNPSIIVTHFILFIGILSIILIVKPLTAFIIVLALKYPMRTAVTIAIALAQIGEFSFILAEEAMKFNLVPDDGYDLIVACALVSISINPLFFKASHYLMEYIERKRGSSPLEEKKTSPFSQQAVVVGYGPIGQEVTRVLKKMGVKSVIIDRNIDTITKLKQEKYEAVYGDASFSAILKAAHIDTAGFLIITTPEINVTVNIIKTIHQLNLKIPILARVRYLSDKSRLIELGGVNLICCEEESAKTFNAAIFKLMNQYPVEYSI